LLDGLEGAPTALPCLAPPVTTRIKADMTCAAVAGASVLAKTTRDAMMTARHEDFPHYGWAGNKGYSAPEHLEALSTHGSCEQHRRSWRLPGLGVPAPRLAGGDLPALDLPALDLSVLDLAGAADDALADLTSDAPVSRQA
jgi:ribonuclease HII